MTQITTQNGRKNSRIKIAALVVVSGFLLLLAALFVSNLIASVDALQPLRQFIKCNDCARSKHEIDECKINKSSKCNKSNADSREGNLKIIGIMPAVSELSTDGNTIFVDAYKQKYGQFIYRACHDMPILIINIPSNTKKIDEYVALADGFVFTGGPKNIDSSYYGGGYSENIDRTGRIDFYFDMLKAADKEDKSVLGICLGMQAINVYRGGSLKYIKHVDTKLQHMIDFDYSAKHNIKFNKDSKLYSYINKPELKVNSAHNLCVDKIGKNLTVSSSAEDGIAESIEDTDKAFFIGVQWHPEEMSTKNKDQMKIARAFCESLF